MTPSHNKAAEDKQKKATLSQKYQINGRQKKTAKQ